jgi:hypothetical protein
MSHGASGASLMGGTGGRVLQCQRGRERVRRTPLVSHDARRTGLPRRRRLDAGGGLVFRWRGGEAIGGRHGEAWWGARRRWRTEWMGKKNGEKRGAGSTVALMAARWRGRRGKRSRGSGVRRHMDGKMGKREGPQARWGTARAADNSPRPVGEGGAVATRQGRRQDASDAGAGDWQAGPGDIRA